MMVSNLVGLIMEPSAYAMRRGAGQTHVYGRVANSYS